MRSDLLSAVLHLREASSSMKHLYPDISDMLLELALTIVSKNDITDDDLNLFNKHVDSLTC